MGKYRIMLIDDETFIRARLKRLIEQSGLPFEIAGEAKNGEEALRLIEDCFPHVAITDIQMPRMDGLDFIKELRRRKPDIRVLILTGFDRFEYAREALRCKVDDFLLKPLSESALEAVLHKLQRVLGAIRHQEEATVGLLLRDYLNKGTDEEALRLHWAESGLPVAEGEIYRIAVADAPTGAALLFAGEIGFAGPDRLQTWLLKRHAGEPVLPPGVSVRLGFSRAFQLRPDRPEAIRGAYEQAVGALNGKWFTAETALRADPGMPARPPEAMRRNYGLLRKIVGAAEEGQPDRAKARVKEAFESFRAAREVELPFLQLLAQHLNERLEISSGHPAWSGEETPLSWILRRRTLDELERCLTELVDTVSFAMGQRRENANPFIDKALEYIHHHFNEELSLAQISSYVSLNPNYFCGLFKSVTGMNFKQYMAHYRIGVAKELLLEGCWSLAEISYMVGYADEKYFSRVFKKLTGRQPQQFGKVSRYAACSE